MSRDLKLTRDLDWVLLGATLLLAAIGVAFIHSATSSGGGLSSQAKHQLAYLAFAVGVAVVLVRIDYHRLVGWAPWLYGLGLALLVATLLFGAEVKGNRAWLRLGPLSLQPSEPVKLATVLLVGQVMQRIGAAPMRLRHGLVLGAAVLAPVGLVLLQKDKGTALTFLPLLAAIVFVQGLRWRWILLGVLALALAAPAAWTMLEPYQKDRLRVVVQPELDPDGIGYHPLQSRIAVGSGGILGRGYAQGEQNRHGFLPERHNDFIFAVIAEEWGFVGSLAVLGLVLLLLTRIAEAAATSRDRVGTFLCVGALTFLAVHVVMNVGMVLAVLPTIGVPFPLLSFGGSALLTSCCLVALVLNVRLRRLGP
jgi:rod shape determining protein RodA